MPTSYFGPWPDGVPVQIHGMDAGDQHYFADSSLSSYDPDAAALLTQRVLSFLGTR